MAGKLAEETIDFLLGGRPIEMAEQFIDMGGGLGDLAVNYIALGGVDLIAEILGFAGRAEALLHFIDQEQGVIHVGAFDIFLDGEAEALAILLAKGDLFGGVGNAAASRTVSSSLFCCSMVVRI